MKYILTLILSASSLAYAVGEKAEMEKPPIPQYGRIIWADTLVVIDGKRAVVTLGFHKNGMVSWR